MKLDEIWILPRGYSLAYSDKVSVTGILIEDHYLGFVPNSCCPCCPAYGSKKDLTERAWDYYER